MPDAGRHPGLRLEADAIAAAHPTEAEMLADGTICQPGQPFACGDFHTAGQCVRPRDTDQETP